MVMQYVYIIVLGLHVLTGVFFAGTTITLARIPEIHAEKFFQPQMRAAGLAMLTGALLWYFFHGAYFGSMEIVLAIGIIATFAAAGVLGAFVGSARRKLAGADATEEARLRTQMAKGQRIAAGLLVLTIVCMAIARMV
jgi:hypothetical protein